MGDWKIDDRDEQIKREGIEVEKKERGSNLGRNWKGRIRIQGQRYGMKPVAT